MADDDSTNDLIASLKAAIAARFGSGPVTRSQLIEIMTLHMNSFRAAILADLPADGARYVALVDNAFATAEKRAAILLGLPDPEAEPRN